MSQDNPDTPAGGARARRVGTSRVVRRAGSPRGGKRKRKLAGHVVAKVITASLLSLGLMTGLAVVVVYNHWNANLDHQEISDLLTDRPEKKEVEGPQEPLNILVMGSDTREGDNAIDGEAGGGVSDTTIMIHLSADREFAYGISIPRDTLVDRPECTTEEGETTPAVADAMWNAAYATGGPACTVQQFEQTSGVRIDNYLVLDFSGFKNMVNALDGVEVCIPEDIYDPAHGITLEAGTREIRDDEALSYVRVRYSVGDGTDPNRIKRQQAFMGSMINKVLSAGTLARPDRLIGFGNALTDSIQTDFDSVGQMADLAGTLQGIGPSNVKFVTTPWEYSTTQEGRVEWLPEVEKLWQLVIDDQPLTQEFIDQSISAADDPDGSTAATDTASPSDTASADPSDPGDTASPSTGGKRGNGGGGLSDEARAAAGLCT